MRVLVACEYSGRVRDAFARHGFNAMSCDLLPTETVGQHMTGDVVEILNSVPDGYFDLIVAHPPCTALTVAGNKWYGEGQPRYQDRLDSAQWTEMLWELCKRKGKRVAFENPVGVLARLTKIPKAQYVQPYWFGHTEQKKTGFHTHNLPKIAETNNVYDEMMLLPKRERERLHYLPPSPDRWKIRSTTFQGIANALSAQWGAVLYGIEGLV